MRELTIRPADSADHTAVWAILEPVFRAGDTYTQPQDITREAALAYWLGGTHTGFVAQTGSGVLGTYYIGPNQLGGGAHVCNCGFATSPEARGKGIARQMLAHALATAQAQHFRAMQFNFVVSTNAPALKLWSEAGFAEVGRLPGAFQHPEKGFVDALVLFKTLEV
jgi:ribosomal protein S18 acetylase RimI-like enzyme